jgi:hypothetical protein
MDDLLKAVRRSGDRKAKLIGQTLSCTLEALALAHQDLGRVSIPYDAPGDTQVEVRNHFAFASVAVHPAWRLKGTVWYLPLTPDLHVACITKGAVEIGSRNAYSFADSISMLNAARLAGYRASLPGEELLKRPAEIVVFHKTRVVARVRRFDSDADLPKWNTEDAGWWSLVLGRLPHENFAIIGDYDSRLRCLESVDHNDAGWVIKTLDGHWSFKSFSAVKTVLQSHGNSKLESECIMGHAALRPWKLVTEPFQPEEDAKRRTWNRGAAQLAYKPSFTLNWKADCPHWFQVLNHIGADLNVSLTCGNYGFESGSDYLFAWIAAMIQQPREKTPYLFLFGPENSGKSIIHEAIAVLFEDGRGVVMADRALTNQSDFNGELENAVLCVVEERNISKTPGALAKIKAAVTSPRLSIRKMRQCSYMTDNLTHWIQVANERDACPIFPGDTRITAIFVPPLPAGAEIPKDGRGGLIDRLKAEAPAFTFALLNSKLPEPTGRLMIPVVANETKARLQELRLPEIVVAVAAMSEKEWSGTASELRDHFDLPESFRDFRVASKELERHESYLRQRRVKVEFVIPKGSHSKRIVLKRMRAV